MEDFEPIEFDKIQKGMYLKYRTRPFKYQDGREVKGGMRAGGYVSFVNSDDRFIGFTSYNKNWSAQEKNVSEWYVSTVKKQRLEKDDADAEQKPKRRTRQSKSA